MEPMEFEHYALGNDGSVMVQVTHTHVIVMLSTTITESMYEALRHQDIMLIL